MSFEFKKADSARKNFKQIALRGLEKALHDLHQHSRFEGVHEVRKTIKQLRALLRLFRGALKRSDYRACSESLREAAMHLGIARDAHVRETALARLLSSAKRPVPKHAFQRLRRALRFSTNQTQSELTTGQTYRKVASLLNQFEGRLARAKLTRKGWAAIGPGLKRTYRDGRRCYGIANQADVLQQFHQWRKRVKDLYYQVKLLAPVWPRRLIGAVAELKTIGELLGDDHDLFLLIDPALAPHFQKEPALARQEEALNTLIRERQKKLKARALALGAKFYDEKTSSFCKRVGRHWKKWRR